MSKSLVSKATTDDAKEPTGFQLKELAQHSYDSLSACTEMADLLLKKLDKESADVKYKALKCIKYVCLHGRGEFRMDVQKEAGTIKQALHFKGPPDPLRGDAPFQRVRDEAKECINAVFNGPATRPGGGSGKMEGYGGGGDIATGSPTSEMSGGGRGGNFGYEGTYSDSRASSSSSAPASAHPNINDPISSSGKMVGFGNPQYDNAKSSPSFIDKMKTKMQDATGRGGSSGGASTGPYKPYAGSGAYNPSSFTPPPIATLDTSNGAGRKKGEVGGVWASGGGGGGGSFQPHNASNNNGGGGGAAPNGGGYAPRPVRPTSSNGEYETRLIDSLTPAAGVRSVPSKDELSKFVLQCESLDKLLVVRLINEQKLPAGVPPASQMKALCLVECILTTGNAHATEEVDDYLCENAANLEALETQGATPQLRNKAVRVMELCGLREEKKSAPLAATAAPVGAATNFYQQQQQQQPAKDQIDLFGGYAPSPSSVPTPAPSLASASSAFGFLGGAEDSHSGANGNGGDMFGSLEVKASSASPNQQGAPITLAAQQPHDPFDMFANTSVAASQPQQPQRASPPAANNSSDPLAFLSSPTPLPSSSSAGKVDPLTLLMSTTRISSQPRAPFQQQQQPPQMQMQQPFGANGMAGFPPRGNNMPPLGPPQQQQQQQYQQQGFQQQGFQQGYPQQGYPQQQQQGYPQQGYGQQQQQYQQQPQMQMGGFGGSAASAQANQNMLFQVKAAGSNQGLSNGIGGGGNPLPSHMRPTIELDASGNPIVLGGSSSSTLGGGGGVGGNGTQPGSSAFGFVAGGGDSFGFVNDILASTSGKQ